MTKKDHRQTNAKNAAETVHESYPSYDLSPDHTSSEDKERLIRTAEVDAQSRKQLIEQHIRLVHYYVNKYAHMSVPREDLVSVGTAGLIKAIESYQPDRGARLVTFADRCIENEILIYIRKTGKKSISTSVSDHSNVLLGMMKTIHISEREPYDVVSRHLANESQESMLKLNSLLKGAGRPGGEKPIGDRRS